MRIWALLGVVVFWATSVFAQQPNVVLIFADDLGWGELGAYGQAKIRTPNLDRLAAQGMRFTRAYSASPVCAPSRCALMTGMHTGHAAIRGNKEMGGWGPEEPEGQWPLPAGEVTLAERLRELGYQTGAFGKWGLGGPGSEGHPNRQGFDHFYGYLCQRVAHNYYPTHLWRNSDVDVLGGNDYFASHQRLDAPPADDDTYDRFRGGDYAPEEIADEAIAWLGRAIDNRRPFFLYYPSVIPHAALQAPQEFIDAYPPEWDPEPYLGHNGYLPTPRPHATYAAMISYLDHNVGRVLDLLDERGLADNTIVIFSSDNGTAPNGGVDRAFFESLHGLRGFKTNVYEGGIRVPLIVRWPGHIEAGAVRDHICALYDLFPTVMDLIGDVQPPAEGAIDGLSFAPTLLGRGEQQKHDYLYWEFPEGGQEEPPQRQPQHRALRPAERPRGIARPGERTADDRRASPCCHA